MCCLWGQPRQLLLSEWPGGKAPAKLRSLRPIFREQPPERKEEKYVTLWDNFEAKANRDIFPDFLDTLLLYANLKLFSRDMNSDDLNKGHRNSCKMKLVKFWKE